MLIFCACLIPPIFESEEVSLVYNNKQRERLTNYIRLRCRPQRAQAVREAAVLLANDSGALGWRNVRHLVRREVMLQLDIRLLRHLAHERVYLVLRRRHGSRRAHRVFHIRRLYVEVGELRLKFVHDE